MTYDGKWGRALASGVEEVFCDVDGAIILWADKQGNFTAGSTKVAKQTNTDPVPNEECIKFLRDKHSKGSRITLWSMGGITHCMWAAKLCGIEDIVSTYLRKPSCIIDDKPKNMFRRTKFYNQWGALVNAI